MSVPKKIHQIWLGGGDPPARMAQWSERWAELHPEWDFKIWHEAELAIFETPEIKRLLERCCHLSQRSNIYRYLLMRDVGGLYVDTDLEPIQAIDPLVFGEDAIVGEKGYAEPGPKRFDHAVNFFLLAPPQHPLFVAMADAENLRRADVTQSTSLGFPYLRAMLRRWPDRVVVLPKPALCPIDPEDPAALDRPASDFPGSYAIHRWSSKWFPRSFAGLPTKKSSGEIWLVTLAKGEPYSGMARNLAAFASASGLHFFAHDGSGVGLGIYGQTGEAPYMGKRHAVRYAFEHGAGAVYCVDADVEIRDPDVLRREIIHREIGIHTRRKFGAVTSVEHWFDKPGQPGRHAGMDVFREILQSEGCDLPPIGEGHLSDYFVGWCVPPEIGVEMMETWDRVSARLQAVKGVWSDGVSIGIAAARAGVPIVASMPPARLDAALVHLSIGERKNYGFDRRKSKVYPTPFEEVAAAPDPTPDGVFVVVSYRGLRESDQLFSSRLDLLVWSAISFAAHNPGRVLNVFDLDGSLARSAPHYKALARIRGVTVSPGEGFAPFEGANVDKLLLARELVEDRSVPVCVADADLIWTGSVDGLLAMAANRPAIVYYPNYGRTESHCCACLTVASAGQVDRILGARRLAKRKESDEQIWDAAILSGRVTPRWIPASWAMDPMSLDRDSDFSRMRMGPFCSWPGGLVHSPDLASLNRVFAFADCAAVGAPMVYPRAFHVSARRLWALTNPMLMQYILRCQVEMKRRG